MPHYVLCVVECDIFWKEPISCKLNSVVAPSLKDVLREGKSIVTWDDCHGCGVACYRKKLRVHSVHTRKPEGQKWLPLIIIHHKATEGAVVRLFTFFGKEAAWYLLHFPVVGDALTAFSSFLTIICACVSSHVLLDCTFHNFIPRYLLFSFIMCLVDELRRITDCCLLFTCHFTD